MAPAKKPSSTQPGKNSRIPKTAGKTKKHPFAAHAGAGAVPLQALTVKETESWLKKAPAATRSRAAQSGFLGKPGQILPLYNDKGRLTEILFGVNVPLQVFDLAVLCDFLIRTVDEKILGDEIYTLRGIADADLNRACVGWGLGSYRYDTYKGKKSAARPVLAWPEKSDQKIVIAHLESTTLIRDLINTPANDMGPDELESAAAALAAAEGLTLKIIRDKDLLKQNFPLVYAVGKGSSRRPRLLDLQWGNAKHPKVTLVGKGVCFDTGGLNIKPGPAMYTMKKDMGGAAHALGLALLIIRHKLPVRLRVLIPAVENAISGDSFRPSDVIKSRKGLTVEIGDTDAEGRLVLADALALACEEKPDFLINFATLTGAARVALGPDLPAIFSNREKIAMTLKDIGMAQDDPVWPLPLWPGYRRDLASDIADTNSVGGKAGAITAALFLENFVDEKIDWVHVDLYAWSDSAKPGRTKGGTEMTSRTVLAYLQARFGKK